MLQVHTLPLALVYIYKLCPLVTTRGCISCRHNQSRERYVVGLKGLTGSICKGKLLQPIPEPGDAQCMLVADAVLYFQTAGIRSAF